MTKTFRAIEVGYGTTSVTTDNTGDTVETFSSVVVNEQETAAEQFGYGDSSAIKVKLRDNSYRLVGSANEERTTSIKIMNADYVTTSDYEALFLAALSLCNAKNIDYLACGLPVNNMSMKGKLEELFTGEHVVEGNKITVGKVVVVAQPLGLLVDYILSAESDDDAITKRILPIDCGYLTVDFLVAIGLEVNSTKHGAVDLGMGVMLERIQKLLQKQLETRVSLSNIDRAFYENHYKGKSFLTHYGQKLPFPTCTGKTVDGVATNDKFDVQNEIDDVTNDAISHVKNIVGDGQDIDEIVVGGGSGVRYISAIKRIFPKHKVTIAPKPLTAVCRGLHQIVVNKFGG